jgi:hypothetical protein
MRRVLVKVPRFNPSLVASLVKTIFAQSSQNEERAQLA